MPHLGDIVNAVQHTGGDQPFDRLIKVPGPAALPDSAVGKLLVGFGQLGDNAAEYHQDASAVHLSVVLGEVILVDLKEFPLDLGDCRRIFVIDPTRRHIPASRR